MSTRGGNTGSLFERWSYVTYDHHRVVLALLVPFLLVLASLLPGLEFDTSDIGWLEESHPAIVAFKRFQDQFGRDDRIVVGVRGDEVFSIPFLERLRALHRAIEREVPHLDRVESLINARAVYGKTDELVVEDLLGKWPRSQADLDCLRSFAFDNRAYENLFLSPDGRFTAIQIRPRRYATEVSDADAVSAFALDDAAEIGPGTGLEPLNAEQRDAIVDKLGEVVAAHSAPGFEVYLTGSPVVNKVFSDMLLSEFITVFSVVSVLFAVLLFFVFRTPLGALAPLSVMILSQISVFATMSLAGSPVQIPTLVLSSLLAALSIADSIHILAIYYQRLEGLDRRTAIGAAMAHSGAPVFFTTLTTACGFVSFVTSDLRPVAELGIFTPIGVFFALAYTITLVPALVACMPETQVRAVESTTLSERVLARIGLASLRHPKTVVVAALALLPLSIAGITRLGFSQDLIAWMQQNSEIVIATRQIERHMAGTTSFEMLVTLPQGESFEDPRNLSRLDGMVNALTNLNDPRVKIGDSISLVDVVKEVNKALNENRDDAYVLPDRRDLISQELLLFENSGYEALDQLASADYAETRITSLVHRTDAMYYGGFLDRVRDTAARFFDPGAITLTGYLVIGASTFGELVNSLIDSYILVLILIIPLMMLLVRSVRTGAFAMAPNLLPILFCLGTMGLAGIALNAMNLMIAGIAIGLVVDDTIHFLHHFERYYAMTGSVEEGVLRTLRTAGRAMLFTTIVVVVASSVNIISGIYPVAEIGVLLPFIVSLALAADIVLMPALVAIFYKDTDVSAPESLAASQPEEISRKGDQ